MWTSPGASGASFVPERKRTEMMAVSRHNKIDVSEQLAEGVGLVNLDPAYREVCIACGQECDRRDPEELLCSCQITIWPSEHYNIKVQQRTFECSDLQERAVLRVITSRTRATLRSHMRDPSVVSAAPVLSEFSVQEMRVCARITCGRIFRPPRTNLFASHCCRVCRYGYEVHDDRCQRRFRDTQAFQNVMPVS